MLDHVSAGGAYKLNAYVFHDSKPVGLTATIMTKTRLHTVQPCTVAVPLGITPDNSFKRNSLSQEFMWNEVKNVCLQLA